MNALLNNVMIFLFFFPDVLADGNNGQQFRFFFPPMNLLAKLAREINAL